MIAEEEAEEEVARVVVVGRLKTELRCLSAAIDRQRVRLTLLLTCYRRQKEIPDLELALDPKQTLPAADQARRRLQHHVTGFDTADGLVFVAGVTQSELVLIVELVGGKSGRAHV